MMGRPKNNDYPDFMSDDGDRGGYIVRNPETGVRQRFKATERDRAEQTARRLGEWILSRRQRKALEAGRPNISALIVRWKAERLQLQPWDKSTRETFEMRLNRIDREMGSELVEMIDCIAIERWLTKTAKRADPFNKWRHAWVLLWRFAVSQKIAKENEAEKVEARSTSRKIASNKKRRQQLDVAGFNEIHKLADPWLQLAMELSLVTLQSRNEVCHMKHSDFRDGFLFVIRDKVAADSSMAFIKIRLTSELEALRARGSKLDDIVSPFLVHRRPDRKQRRWMTGKAHWTFVNGRYLTRAFKAARDQIERFARLGERDRPTFHEIRGLGSRLHKERGVSKEAISDLMTHSDEKTTEIYLELGPQALTDDHFHAVSAPFTVRELLGSK